MSKVSASILDADILNFKREIKRINAADMIHLDIMDGHFVNNLSFGSSILKAIRKITRKYVETHLMVFNPERFWRDFVLSGSNRIIFHVEATPEPIKFIKALRRKKVSVGITLNPNTEVELIRKYLPFVDLVLVMSVQPGKGGQRFIKRVLEKVKELDITRKSKGYKFLLEIDGGINYYTGKLAVNSGVDVLVVGSFLFKDELTREKIDKLKSL